MKLTLYHGSDSEFSAFRDAEKSRWVGKGIYFTEQYWYAKLFGKYVYTCEVTVDNPKIYEDSQDYSKDEFKNSNLPELIAAEGYDSIIIKRAKRTGRYIFELVKFSANGIRIIDTTKLSKNPTGSNMKYGYITFDPFVTEKTSVRKHSDIQYRLVSPIIWGVGETKQESKNDSNEWIHDYVMSVFANDKDADITTASDYVSDRCITIRCTKRMYGFIMKNGVSGVAWGVSNGVADIETAGY